MTTPTLDAMLEEIGKRANAATEGPWIVSSYENNVDSYIGPSVDDDDKSGALVGKTVLRGGRHTTWDDLDFASHARTDVPRLVKALRFALGTLRGLSGGDDIAAMASHLAIGRVASILRGEEAS